MTSTPTPGPRPTPLSFGPRPPRQRPPVGPPTEPPQEIVSDAASWGRADDTGTVFVRTAEGERQVGQMPDGTPDEALAFFARKFDALAFEVTLLERRVETGTANPDETTTAVTQLLDGLAEAAVVGDLESLRGRLEALFPKIDAVRAERKAERARRAEQSTKQKEALVAEAEKLADSNDWRAGADRLRTLLEEWKQIPRLDRATDDALWRRFSTARTTYTRRRKAHFAELSEKREDARSVKEKLAKEAEALATSTDWGATSGAYRELMRRWKLAGPAPKDVDEALWKRFREAQDAFFGARDAANAAENAEFEGNAAAKEAILLEAEALLPITDLTAAKTAFRDLSDRWEAAGKVPREKMRDLEGRMRKVELAIRGVEDDAWKKSNPEARARAADAVAQLESLLADLAAKHDKAEAAGQAKKAAEFAASIEARQAWLTEAHKALAEFGG